MTATFVFGKDVDSSAELVVWDDGTWLSKDLATLDLVVGDTTEKGADVVAGLSVIKGLTEHLKTSDDGLLGGFDANDFSFVVDLDLTTLDTASDDGATARDGHNIFDWEKEWLVSGSLWIWDVGIEGFKKLVDWSGSFVLGRSGLASL